MFVFLSYKKQTLQMASNSKNVCFFNIYHNYRLAYLIVHMLRKRKKQTSGERAFNGLRYEIKKKTNIMLLEEATQKPVRY